MASTYTSSHQIELIGDGEQAGDWGGSTNENWDRIESAVSASYVIRVDSPPTGSAWSSGTKTLEWITDNTTDQGSSGSEGRSGVVIFTDNGDLGGTVTVEIRGDVASAVPERVFVVTNKLSGGQSITFNADPADTGGTVTLANDRSALIFTSVLAKGAGTAHALAANSAVNALNKLQLDTISAGGGGFVGDLVGDVSATQVDITGQGDLRLQDTTGGQYVALQAAGTTTSYTLTMPGAVGSVNQVLSASDGAGALAWTTPEVGDITSVANVTNGGLAVTNGTGPDVTLALDFNDLSAATVNVAADSVAIIDADASNGTRKESIADLATAMGGTGLTGSSGVLNVDPSQTQITSVGTIGTGVWNGDAVTGDYIDVTSSPLANTKIWIGDASGDADEFALSGDATMTAGGAVTVSTAAACTGNSATATKLASGRTIGMTGDVVWTSPTFDGSGNVTATAAIQPNSVTLGTDTTGNYVASGAVSGTGLSGSASAEGASFTVTSNATDANTASTIVARDGSGDFSAGTITASLTGNSATATEATNVTVIANNSTDETVYPVFVDGATGTQGAETDTGLTYNPSSGILTSAAFSGGGASLTSLNGSNISSGTVAAARVATLNQDTTGTAAIATTVTVADESSDTTCFPVFVTGDTGNLAPKSGSNLTFNSSSGVLSTLSFLGALTGNVYGDLFGNAATATALATARAINGVDFDGTGAITVTAAAGTLSGSTLASGVTASSLTSTGTVATGTWGSDITMGSGDALSVSGGATLKLEGNHPTGTANLGLGVNSLDSIAAGGASNIAIGNNAGKEFTTEDQNVVMGTSAGQHIATTGAGVGDNNTLVGHQAGKGDTGTNEATDNTAVGSCALETIKEGTHNSFLGRQSGHVLEDGSYNSGVGFQAGKWIVDGSSNVCIGTQSGRGVVGGTHNVCIGTESGDNTTDADMGSNNLVIHSESDGLADPVNEALIYGNFNTGRLHFNSNSTSSHVKIQNTNSEADSWYFLECRSDSDGSAETEAYIRGDGDIGGTAFTTISADYADMFEWADGNPDDEDRIGLSVVLDGQGGIRIATGADAAEDVIGIVSGTACMVGNAAWNSWDKTFLKDDFGRPTDEPNPDYDESLTYVPRQERKEWAIIGLTGRVHLRKGSPANPSWRKIRDVSAVTEEWLVR